MRDAYAEGVEARLAGIPEHMNPFDFEDAEDDFMNWNDGWASVDQEDEE